MAASIVKRQGAGIDRAYVVGWLKEFEAALDDSRLVSAYLAL